MVKFKKPKKIKEENILPLDNTEALSDKLNKSEEFVKKNQNLIFIISGVLVAFILIFSFFNYFKETQNGDAQQEMFQAVYYYEQDSLVKALNGDGNNYGFLEIIDEYSLSEAANLSKFYAGSSYLKLGNYNNAINYLSDFSSSDYLLQARAFSLIGDAYVELSDFDNAIYFFQKASDYNPNEFFTPSYLIKLALVHERVNDFKSALNCYSYIIKDFKGSPEYQNAIKNKSRIEGLLL
tara:strand:- start:7 stop:717 length:711 start_codon:yes stop_codon:yes gene_type:complete